VTVAPWEAGFFLPMMLLGGMPLGLVRFLGERFGWWLGLLAGLALLPFLAAGGLCALAWWLLKAAVYVGSRLRVCPACGARRWHWPKTGPVPLP
jgi:hypothetical protein